MAMSAPDAVAVSAVEREAQWIANIIGSVAPGSIPSSGTLVMRQAAPKIVQQIEEEAPVIDQLIDVTTIGLGVAWVSWAPTRERDGFHVVPFFPPEPKIPKKL
jgi:hypothetical protein